MPYIRAELLYQLGGWKGREGIGGEGRNLWLLNSGTTSDPSATVTAATRRASRRSCARRVDLSPRLRATEEESEFQARRTEGMVLWDAQEFL